MIVSTPFRTPILFRRRRRRIYDGKNCGVCSYRGGRGRLERCELWGNANGGVLVEFGGNPSLQKCILRDHVVGRACGVYVRGDARGLARVGADCVFSSNAKGDVVRM